MTNYSYITPYIIPAAPFYLAHRMLDQRYLLCALELIEVYTKFNWLGVFYILAVTSIMMLNVYHTNSMYWDR